MAGLVVALPRIIIDLPIFTPIHDVESSVVEVYQMSVCELQC